MFPRTSAILIAGALAAAPAAAQDDGPSIDELLGIPDAPANIDPPQADSPQPDPAQADPANPDADPQETQPDPLNLDDLDPELARELSGLSPGDVFARAVADMGDVAVRLGRAYDPGVDTQREQQRIVDRLEILVRMMDSPQGGSSGQGEPQAEREQDAGSASAQGQTGAADAGRAQAAGDATDPQGAQASPGSIQNTDPATALEDLREGRWGNLPPRLRDQLAESFDEPFSSPYRRLTEQYYLRLAEALRRESDDAN
ncbi:MAG: hypothetical protein AAGA57_02735 [Planctomycetota bacterium]